MPVYVDDMYLLAMGRLGHMKMSHMVADTEEELHAMAALVGLKREWYQYPKTPWPHYDVSLSVRQKLIEAGASPISMRQAVAIAKACRKRIYAARDRDEE